MPKIKTITIKWKIMEDVINATLVLEMAKNHKWQCNEQSFYKE